MALERMIETYGYWAILAGTFLEGETILVLGGFAAHQGYLALPWVILAAFTGTLCADQLFFYLGRNYGPRILAWRPSWQARAEKAQRLLERFQTFLILSFRFLYGLRTITPFVIGISGVSRKRFFFLNVVGAFAWAGLIGVGGYLLGNAIEVLLGNVKKYEMKILGAVTLLGILIWMIHLFRRRGRKNHSP